jgi:hypothetical protein
MDEEFNNLIVQIVGFTWMFFMLSPLWICLILGISAHFIPGSKVEPEVNLNKEK